MAVHPIRIVGDPVLRTATRPVEKFDDELGRLVEDMFETMAAANGVGLAANQIGVDLRLFVYPMLRDEQVTTIDNLVVDEELQPLYDYLARRGSFVDLDNYKPDYLPILSRDVLRRIAEGDELFKREMKEEWQTRRRISRGPHI